MTNPKMMEGIYHMLREDMLLFLALHCLNGLTHSLFSQFRRLLWTSMHKYPLFATFSPGNELGSFSIKDHSCHKISVNLLSSKTIPFSVGIICAQH